MPMLADFGVIHIALIIAFGIALFVLIRRLSGKKAPRNTTEVDLSQLTVADARRGDMITISGAAANYDDLNFQVESVHRYSQGRDSWQELVGPSPDGRVALEWYDDDGLTACLTLGQKGRRLNEVGLTEDDLVKMDEQQDWPSSVVVDGRPFRFDSSKELIFHEDGAGGEGFYCWEFEAEDRLSTLSIEKWEGEAFEVFESKYVKPSDIQVFRT